MFLKVLDMCDIRAQGSMPSAQPGMLAVSRRRKVPSGRLGMLHGSLEVGMRGAAGLQGQAAPRHCTRHGQGCFLCASTVVVHKRVDTSK